MRLFEALPSEFRTPAAKADIDGLVVVEVWADGLDFERAHFSDGEIADALLRGGWTPRELTRDRLIQALSVAREHRQSVGTVWANWRSQPSKPALALELWPILRAKIRRKRSRVGIDKIPICRVLARAHDYAVSTPRRHVVFHVGSDDGG
jgi:hypothetical protein